MIVCRLRTQVVASQPTIPPASSNAEGARLGGAADGKVREDTAVRWMKVRTVVQEWAGVGWEDVRACVVVERAHVLQY